MAELFSLLFVVLLKSSQSYPNNPRVISQVNRDILWQLTPDSGEYSIRVK